MEKMLEFWLQSTAQQKRTATTLSLLATQNLPGTRGFNPVTPWQRGPTVWTDVRCSAGPHYGACITHHVRIVPPLPLNERHNRPPPQCHMRQPKVATSPEWLKRSSRSTDRHTALQLGTLPGNHHTPNPRRSYHFDLRSAAAISSSCPSKPPKRHVSILAIWRLGHQTLCGAHALTSQPLHTLCTPKSGHFR